MKRKRIKAKIEDAKLCKILRLWKGKKPPGVGFGLTEAIVIDAKPERGKAAKTILYARLKAEGTITNKVLGRNVKKCHQRLAKFLEYYKLTKEPERYDIKKEIPKWVGKEIEIVKDTGYVYIP